MMDISGIGDINDKYNNNLVQNAKDKAVGDAFEERLKTAMDKKDAKELKKACQEFEGMLLNMLYKEMKATVPKSDLFSKDVGNDIFNSMLDDKLIEQASKSGSFGLAENLYKQLERQMKSVYKPANIESSNTVDQKK